MHGQLIGGGLVVDELRRRGGWREVKRHLDSARNRLAAPRGRRECPLSGCDHRGLVEVGATRRRENVTCDTWPSTSTVTTSTTSACLRSFRADGGYSASTWVTTVGALTSSAGGGACANASGDDHANAPRETSAEPHLSTRALARPTRAALPSPQVCRWHMSMTATSRNWVATGIDTRIWKSDQPFSPGPPGALAMQLQK